ncbi:hypothetical protein EYC84_007859 [Monilinia fructicola]|uniref:Uncharacterized protein n=1 Tax=Monilinia fructicola TaxID=38448 RepID=A0A5M9JJP6_MONFR|nr:hypothetical protein EYC84_007859 [Monilinia fructicola]
MRPAKLPALRLDQGFIIKGNEEHSFFKSPLNPESDMLYVKPGYMYDFCTEPSSLPDANPDLIEQYSTTSFVEKIAISEKPWQQEVEVEPENQLMDEPTWNFPPKIFIIIFHASSKLQSADGNLKLRQHWELDSTPGGEYSLDADDRTFRFHGGEYSGKEDLHRSLEMGIKKLFEADLQIIRQNIKIQPASARTR